jgi:hypothetical protein
VNGRVGHQSGLDDAGFKQMYLPRESAQCYTLCGIDVGLGRFSSAWLNNQPSQSI